MTAEQFDWASQEQALSSLDHFTVVFATGPGSISSTSGHARWWRAAAVDARLAELFAEYVAAIPLLTDPASHGIDGPGFDVVVPSLPGYGFSERPAEVGVNHAIVAERFHRPMDLLGYTRFGAGGDDVGSGVATHVALQAPERLIGIHLTDIDIGPDTEGDHPLHDHTLPARIPTRITRRPTPRTDTWLHFGSRHQRLTLQPQRIPPPSPQSNGVTSA